MTRLTFLGTRADIEEKTENHFYHSSLLLQTLNKHSFRLLIDYGRIHAYDLSILKPDAIIITHAHPDHYIWALEEINTAVPVYLTQETLDCGTYKPIHTNIFIPYQYFTLGPFQILPYRVLHSAKCPAIGFKIHLPDDKVLVYNPDLVDIITKEHVLPGVDLYIGDGSAINKNLIRSEGSMFFGHATILSQIEWCKDYGIKEIIFTHIGSDTINGKDDFNRSFPEIILAYDQMKMTI